MWSSVELATAEIKLAEATANGFATICEGELWLCTHAHMAETASESHDQFDYSQAAFWLQSTDGAVPIHSATDVCNYTVDSIDNLKTAG
jgi:hypothetical protein